ncbi:caspase family protein [Ekhidna sp.]|uniref:caspase family protein n=1 Tax=Ekhidna sp. TaxID=2608089 RepID=UPI003B502997
MANQKRISLLLLFLGLFINQAAAQKINFSDLKQGTTFLVKFNQGRSTLDSVAKEDLRIIAKGFEEYDDLKIEVAGHTDFRGNLKANIKLAKMRADIVTDFLIENGADKKRIEVNAYGGARPLSEEVAAMNRRVELTVVKNSDLAKNFFGVYQRNSEEYTAEQKEVPINEIREDRQSPIKKVALIIGNDDYRGIGTLKNPSNDAQLMFTTLNDLGFEVHHHVNLNYQTMIGAIKEFSYIINGADIVLFYYAGHGMQLNGDNYLIPIDATLKNGSKDLTFEAINTNILLKVFEYTNKESLNILILDACRNNPYQTGARSAGSGLSEMRPPTGTVIAFATSPGAIAFDGDGNNGVYTQELVKQMKKPQRIEDVFMKTRINVEEATDNQQSPWELFRLRGIYYFKK